MIKFGEKDIEEMNINQLKNLHDKMLIKLNDEIKKKELVNDEHSKYEIRG